MSKIFKKGVQKTIYLNSAAVGEIIATGDPEQDMKAAQELLKEKGLYKEINKIDAMHSQANSFANTAKELYERDLKTTPIKNNMSMVPFVVNSAFSIEIYLKTLHIISGNKIKGHSLLSLYNSLDEKLKTIIQGAAQDLSHHYTLEDEEDIVSCIKSLDKAFEQWRYAYEYEKLSYIGFQTSRFVYHVLHESCCRARNK
jgi:HEPN domain-containing protein